MSALTQTTTAIMRLACPADHRSLFISLEIRPPSNLHPILERSVIAMAWIDGEITKKPSDAASATRTRGQISDPGCHYAVVSWRQQKSEVLGRWLFDESETVLVYLISRSQVG